MNKNKTNLSVVNNAGIRVKPSIIVGEQGSYSSGDILDANAIEKVVKGVIGDAAEALDTLEELGGALPTKLSQLLNDVPYLTKDDLEDDGSNGHEYIEIGGIKWATMNVGASSETDYGLYFAWGDTLGYSASQVGTTDGKKAFKWEDYKYGNGTGSPGAAGMTKYNTVDGKTVLDIEDDAVAANWGGRWRMPTIKELQALHDAANCIYTSNYKGTNKSGLVCTDKTDSTKQLFFPCGGSAYTGMVRYGGLLSIVWSSSLLEDGTDAIKGAQTLRFMNGMVSFYEHDGRYSGNSVRGVLDDKYATKQELNESVDNLQELLDAIKDRVTALESAVTALQGGE